MIGKWTTRLMLALFVLGIIALASGPVLRLALSIHVAKASSTA